MLPILFLRDIRQGYLSLEDAEIEQINFDTELDMVQKTLRKTYFKRALDYF